MSMSCGSMELLDRGKDGRQIHPTIRHWQAFSEHMKVHFISPTLKTEKLHAHIEMKHRISNKCSKLHTVIQRPHAGHSLFIPVFVAGCAPKMGGDYEGE